MNRTTTKLSRKGNKKNLCEENTYVMYVMCLMYMWVGNRLTTIRTHKINAKTKSVQSIMCVGDDGGGSVGELKFVTFVVEFVASIESLMVLVAAAKIDDDLSEKLATKDSVRSKFNNSMMGPTWALTFFKRKRFNGWWLLLDFLFDGFFFSPFR